MTLASLSCALARSRIFALLATISLTPKQLEKSVLLSGSDLSYNERTIGLTVHCKSFHARTANCEPTLPLQRSIYAG